MAPKPRTPPAALRDLRALLLDVIQEINDAVPTDRDLRRMWQVRGTEAARAQRKDIAARMAAGTASAKDVVTAVALAPVRSRDEDKVWRDYYASERAYYAQLFRDLATDGRLSRDDLETLAYMVDHSGMLHFKAHVVGKRDDARVIMQPEFEAPDYRWAYALLKLVEAGPVNFRVIECKHCKKLVLVERGVMGRPPKFCLPPANCSNAYAQAKWRRNKALAAAKHK